MTYVPSTGPVVTSRTITFSVFPPGLLPSFCLFNAKWGSLRRELNSDGSCNSLHP